MWAIADWDFVAPMWAMPDSDLVAPMWAMADWDCVAPYVGNSRLRLCGGPVNLL